MRWRTAHRRAARQRCKIAAKFKLYPYQRDMIARLTTSDRDDFTVDTGTDASWVRERFEQELRDVMTIPPEFFGTPDHIDPQRYRKD